MAQHTKVDRLISRLRSAEKSKRDTRMQISGETLAWLCEEAMKVLAHDPVVLDLTAPLNVVGDLHGQYYDLLTFFKRAGNPPQTAYLFLGDYVDRGHNSIETISLLLAYKVKYPTRVWLLRGNHETRDISQMYGFHEECNERYPGVGLFAKFNTVFCWLPLAAIINSRIFCVHGGISQDLKSVDELRQLKRPLNIPDDGLLADLLWADPDSSITGYEASERGTSYTFGPDVVRAFLDQNDFDLLCRAHQCVAYGYEFPFTEQTALTLFSAPNYCGEYGNAGAIMKVDESLRCSFESIVSGDDVQTEMPRATTPNGLQSPPSPVSKALVV
jgi:serine/threonine-protein phosphatase PP1 catalytic subunit